MTINTKEILSILNNTHTKICEKEDFKGNYYNYITDTIYVASKDSARKTPKSMEGLSEDTGRLVMLCHECVHSVQNKMMHIQNIVLSNLSLVLGIAILFLKIFGKCSLIVNLIEMCILFYVCIIRSVLELEAIYKSFEVAKKCIKEKITTNVTVEDVDKSWKIAKKMLPFQMLQMLADKLVLIILMIIISIW